MENRRRIAAPLAWTKTFIYPGFDCHSKQGVLAMRRRCPIDFCQWHPRVQSLCYDHFPIDPTKAQRLATHGRPIGPNSNWKNTKHQARHMDACDSQPAWKCKRLGVNMSTALRPSGTRLKRLSKQPSVCLRGNHVVGMFLRQRKVSSRRLATVRGACGYSPNHPIPHLSNSSRRLRHCLFAVRASLAFSTLSGASIE